MAGTSRPCSSGCLRASSPRGPAGLGASPSSNLALPGTRGPVALPHIVLGATRTSGKFRSRFAFPDAS